MAKVTQRDIAQVLGVSVMTVSNAFNRPDQLSADLRSRVLARAQKMGYTGPDAIARQLRSGKTNAYGVVFDEKLSYAFRDPFSVAWLAAFSAVMEREQASITLLSVRIGDDQALEAMQNAAVDGVAGLCGWQPALKRARERGLPTVYCTAKEPLRDSRPEGDYVVIDDHAAAQEVAELLVRLGHRRICLLAETWPSRHRDEYRPGELMALIASLRSADTVESVSRLRGVIDGAQGADVSLVSAPGNSREAGRRAAGRILDRRDRPTAVVAVSDVLALGFMDACAQRGLVPGEDISVVGFDDVSEAAAGGLTTVRQPIAEKGRIAAELLLDPDRPDRQVILPYELVVRASTGPA